MSYTPVINLFLLSAQRSLLFGAVGAYEWSGGIIVKSEDNVKFFNDSNNGPKFSYLGQ